MDKKQKPEKAEVPQEPEIKKELASKKQCGSGPGKPPEPVVPVGVPPEPAAPIVTAKDAKGAPTNNYRLYFRFKDGTMTERTVRAPECVSIFIISRTDGSFDHEAF